MPEAQFRKSIPEDGRRILDCLECLTGRAETVENVSVGVQTIAYCLGLGAQSVAQQLRVHSNKGLVEVREPVTYRDKRQFSLTERGKNATTHETPPCNLSDFEIQHLFPRTPTKLAIMGCFACHLERNPDSEISVLDLATCQDVEVSVVAEVGEWGESAGLFRRSSGVVRRAAFHTTPEGKRILPTLFKSQTCTRELDTGPHPLEARLMNCFVCPKMPRHSQAGVTIEDLNKCTYLSPSQINMQLRAMEEQGTVLERKIGNTPPLFVINPNSPKWKNVPPVRSEVCRFPDQNKEPELWPWIRDVIEEEYPRQLWRWAAQSLSEFLDAGLLEYRAVRYNEEQDPFVTIALDKSNFDPETSVCLVPADKLRRLDDTVLRAVLHAYKLDMFCYGTFLDYFELYEELGLKQKDLEAYAQEVIAYLTSAEYDRFQAYNVNGNYT